MHPAAVHSEFGKCCDGRAGDLVGPSVLHSADRKVAQTLSGTESKDCLNALLSSSCSGPICQSDRVT